MNIGRYTDDKRDMALRMDTLAKVGHSREEDIGLFIVDEEPFAEPRC